MNDFTNDQQNQNNNYNAGMDNFTAKVLIPFGLVIIGAIGLWASTNKLPVWASWTMAIYLVIVLVKILINPAKNFSSKAINHFSRMRFAMKMRPELRRLSSELNQLLDSQRTSTIPYIISQLFSKLSSEIHTLNCLDRNRQQFQILQSWALSLTDRNRSYNRTEFLQDAAQLSNAVVWYIWACVWLQQVINNKGLVDQLTKDVVSDWNVAVQRISDFTSRVERFMRMINEKYNSNLCITYFQDVKQV